MTNNLLSSKFIYTILVTVMAFVFVLMRIDLVAIKPFFDFTFAIGAAYMVSNNVSSTIDKIPSKDKITS